MPTSFSSCKAVPEIARGEKKGGRRNAHTHAPLHLTLLPSLRNLISICKRSRFAPWKSEQRGAASSVGVLGSICCHWPRGTPGAGASCALEPLSSPSCFPPHPLFPLLQAQPGNEDSLSLTRSHPRFWSQWHFGEGSSSHLTPAKEPAAPHAVPGSHLCMDPFSPCNAQSMFNTPSFLSAPQGDPELLGARVCPHQPSYPDNYAMFPFPGITEFSFPSINMDAQLPVNRTNSNKEGQAARSCSLPPCAPSAATGLDSGGLGARGWIGIFLPKCQARVCVKTKEC